MNEKLGEQTFVKITNNDIYDKVEEICKHIIKTNGDVKLNKIVSRVAVVLSLISLSVLTGINLIPLFI